MDGGGLQTPVAIALQRGATELRLLKRRLEGIEHELEALFFSPVGKLEGDAIAALQEIDLVVQSTQALADFIDRLAAQPEAETLEICLRGALGAVPLRDLAARLDGRDQTGGAAGNPELF